MFLDCFWIQLIKLGMQFEHKVSVALEDINVAMTRMVWGSNSQTHHF